MHWTRCTILCLFILGFLRQVFKRDKILSERSKRNKGQNKNKGSIFVAEPACNSQNTQFGLVLKGKQNAVQVTQNKKISPDAH